jgi:hypothetical protein
MTPHGDGLLLVDRGIQHPRQVFNATTAASQLGSETVNVC